MREVEITPGDLRDLAGIQQVMKGVDLVFHLGAIIAIPYSYLHPAEVVETNLLGTLNVLLAARENAVTRLIHTSSSEVYGSALHVPIDEQHPLQGQSPYSASKIGADKLAESFYCSYALPVVTVRPFNTYGPYQSARAVIPTIISQALTCSELQLGNLETRRDFTYITDTVAGFISAAEKENVEGQVFNLGTGHEVTIREIIELVFKITGRELPVRQDPERMRPERSEVMRLLSDNNKAKELLGWSPAVELEEGLTKTIDWMREHLSLYDPNHYQK